MTVDLEIIDATLTKMEEIVEKHCTKMNDIIKKGFRTTKIKNFKNIQKLEETIKCPEGRIEKESSRVTQHCRSEKEIWN